ncbi:unnamed protein product, partial [Symbiodinium sp. CCMP2456]
SKTKLSDPEIHAMKVGERRVLIDKLLASSIWESKEAKVERPQMKEGDVWDGAAYLNLGAYQHGGITSITSATEKFAQETELAAKLLALDHPDKVFTSIALVKNALMPVHKDSFNLKSTVNLISPLKTAKGSSVWQEMRTREYLPEMGGERLDSMVVPGGRVELRLRWAIKYCPDNRDVEEVVMTSTPLLPLGYEEEQRLRSRVTWLSEFVEEERQIRGRQAERGEYATQRERVLFYKLDEAIDYMNELLSRSHQVREENNVNLTRLTATPEPTPEVEDLLTELSKPLDTVHTVELQEVRRHLHKWTPSIAKE